VINYEFRITNYEKRYTLLPFSRGNTPPAPLKRGVSESPLYRGDLGVCLFNYELRITRRREEQD